MKVEHTLWNRMKNCAFVDYDNEAAAAAAQSQMHRCAIDDDCRPPELGNEMRML
jgi:hypothetical protein